MLPASLGDEEAFLHEHAEIFSSVARQFHVARRSWARMTTDAAVLFAALHERPDFLGEAFLHRLAVGIFERIEIRAAPRAKSEAAPG